MGQDNEVVVESGAASESIQAGYDRIANPEKFRVEQEAKAAEPKPAEEPATAEPAASEQPVQESATDQLQSRIAKLEKQLNDTGGRYGALKQSFEQLQQRLTAAPSDSVDIDDLLKDIKEEFGDGALYGSLKNAFSKLAPGKSIDPEAVGKIVADKISEAKKGEVAEATERLTELRPTWTEDRATPEFKEWMESLPEKARKRFTSSLDPDFVSDRLDEFDAWKKAKVAPKPQPTVKKDPEPPKPSKRLQSAVLPTQGAKPKQPVGEVDKTTSIRAGYDRVANARMR